MLDKETKLSIVLYRFTKYIFIPAMTVVVVVSLVNPEWHAILGDALRAGFWFGLMTVALYALYLKMKK